MGWMKSPQQWTVGGEEATLDSVHADHGGAARSQEDIDGETLKNLPAIVAIAAREQLAFPVVIVPPGAPQRFAPPVAAWTIKSDAQNRTLQTSILIDPLTLKEVSREDFADRHPIDRAIGYGVAWHEGQLFGPLNQLAGIFTALSLIALSITGFLMWRRRKPEGVFGAPPGLEMPVNSRILTSVVLSLAALLPMLALSLVIVILLDHIVVRRNSRIAIWLGATTLK